MMAMLEKRTHTTDNSYANTAGVAQKHPGPRLGVLSVSPCAPRATTCACAAQHRDYSSCGPGVLSYRGQVIYSNLICAGKQGVGCTLQRALSLSTVTSHHIPRIHSRVQYIRSTHPLPPSFFPFPESGGDRVKS